MTPGSRSGALVSLSVVLVVLIVGAFLVVLARSPAGFMSPDDALYLGVGANVLAGHGATSVFGDFAPYHSPLWPVLIQAPHSLVGLDPSLAAHLFTVLAGASIIALTAWFSWRVAAVAAPLAAATILALPFFLTLARGMGLDLPATALTMAYLALGSVAVRRGSVRLGLAAGLLFASAFLVKEIALSFAPVPLLGGLVRTTSLQSILRVGGAILVAGMAATSWWFILFAQQTGLIYRLGAPAWMLGPIAIVGLAVGVAGLAASRWVPRLGRWSSPPARGLATAGWVGAILWSVALVVVFAKAPNGVGSAFLDPREVAFDLAQVGPTVGTILAVGLIGGAVAVVDRIARVRGRRLGVPGQDGQGLMWPDDPHAVDDLIIATICGIPLILLVLSIGEGPRHFTVQLCVLVALGAAGWMRLIAWLLQRPTWRLLALVAVAAVAALLMARPMIDVALGHWRSARVSLRLVAALAGALIVAAAAFTLAVRSKRWRDRPWAWENWRSSRTVAGTALVVLLATGVAIAFASVLLPRTQIASDRERATAVQRIADWVRANVPPGATIAFGWPLALEAALPLHTTYRTVGISDTISLTVDPSQPLGIRVGSNPGAGDWVALRSSPYDVNLLYGYRATSLVSAFQAHNATYWIQTDTDESASPIIQAFKSATGVQLVGHWITKTGSVQLETSVFKVDPATMAFPATTLVSVDALSRIVTALERGTSASSAASALAARVEVVTPDDPRVAGLLQRLRQLAAP